MGRLSEYDDGLGLTLESRARDPLQVLLDELELTLIRLRVMVADCPPHDGVERRQ